MKQLFILFIMILLGLCFIVNFQKHATKKNKAETAKTILDGIY